MRNRNFYAISTLALLLALSLVSPAQAFWGLLGKAGSAAGKGAGAAGAVGKGAATGGAAVAGVEIAEGTNAAVQAAKAAKAGTASEVGVGAKAASAEELSKASGLGKAVPDDIAAMLPTPHKGLLDIPDAGARSWLGTPIAKQTALDADLMVRDYVKLLEGKPAQGPSKASEAVARPSPVPKLPTNTPAAQVPWHAIELLVRAAHLGSKPAQSELDRLCRTSQTSTPAPIHCKNKERLQAQKP